MRQSKHKLNTKSKSDQIRAMLAKGMVPAEIKRALTKLGSSCYDSEIHRVVNLDKKTKKKK